MTKLHYLKKRCLPILLAVFITLSGIRIYQSAARESLSAITASAENWGLSFHSAGEPPTGMASEEELRKYNAFFIGDPNSPVIYLTFDAGFENGNTAVILDVLKEHNVPACFFLVGNYVKTAPALVGRMLEEGHLIGNHTMHHPDMSEISDIESFKRELLEFEALLKEFTPEEFPRLYRPPQGKYSIDNLQQAQELGYATFFWSLAYVDWYTDNQPTADQAFSKLLPRIHNGAIVLLHSTSSTNAAILDELLTNWENAGYSFGKLTDLYDTSNLI